MWLHWISHVLRIVPSKMFLFPQHKRPHMCHIVCDTLDPPSSLSGSYPWHILTILPKGVARLDEYRHPILVEYSPHVLRHALEIRYHHWKLLGLPLHCLIPSFLLLQYRLWCC